MYTKLTCSSSFGNFFRNTALDLFINGTLTGTDEEYLVLLEDFSYSMSVWLKLLSKHQQIQHTQKNVKKSLLKWLVRCVSDH